MAPERGGAAPPPAPGGWRFFVGGEGATVEALVDRLIPPDPDTPGGKDAGCAVYLDRQLAGPYGGRRGLYVGPPFAKGTKSQGPQDADSSAELYRKALAALDAYAKAHKGDVFAKLSAADQDETMGGLEKGDIKLEGVDAQSFFATLIKDVQEGFFADPMYGGNRNQGRRDHRSRLDGLDPGERADRPRARGHRHRARPWRDAPTDFPVTYAHRTSCAIASATSCF